MKRKKFRMGKTIKPLILSAFMILFVIPAISRGRNGSIYESSKDSINCGKHLSAYRTFFNLQLYKDAYPTWLKAFKDCPASRDELGDDFQQRIAFWAAADKYDEAALIDPCLVGGCINEHTTVRSRK